MIKTSYTVTLLVALIVLLACATDVARAQEVPDVAARAWALTDVRSGEVPAGENASARLPMASTTKIMVALVARGGSDEASLWERVWYTASRLWS